METVFRSFCSFGADKGSAGADKGSAGAALMDGMKLVKLCRDLKLLDKNLLATDVDIVFSKVKPKTERKINFSQFEEALKMIAEKKYPGTEDALDKLKAKILEGGGPVAHGVTKVVKVAERMAEGHKVTTTAPPAAHKGKQNSSSTTTPPNTPTGRGKSTGPSSGVGSGVTETGKPHRITGKPTAHGTEAKPDKARKKPGVPSATTNSKEKAETKGGATDESGSAEPEEPPAPIAPDEENGDASVTDVNPAATDGEDESGGTRNGQGKADDDGCTKPEETKEEVE